MVGVSTSGNSRRVHVLNNVLVDQSSRGISVNATANVLIEENTVTSNILAGVTGIWLTSCSDTISIQKNMVDLFTTFHGIRIVGCIASGGNRGLLANNFVVANGSGSFNGINTTSSTSVDVIFNSVHVIGGSGTAGAFGNTGGVSTDVRVVNNIFSNTAGGMAFNMQNNSGYSQFDNNVLYYTGANLGRVGASNYANLAAWTAATTNDSNSIVADPEFVSNTDLHITSCSPAIGEAIPFGSVSDDIDFDLRPFGAAMDIGADENTCTPVYASINDTICVGDTTIILGQAYWFGGVFQDTICGVAAGGCDSIFTVTIIQPANINTNSNVTACDSALVNGTWYYSSQAVVDVFTSVITGCDSIHTTNLTINPSYAFTIDTTIFVGDTFFVGIICLYKYRYLCRHLEFKFEL